MSGRRPAPGVSREERLGDFGLARLERQLQRGTAISSVVLRQWIRRYGDAARELLRRYDRYHSELEPESAASPHHSSVQPLSRHCPRCGARFNCFRGAIEQCPCRRVELPAGLASVLAGRYEGCLCSDCLRILAAEYGASQRGAPDRR